MKRPRGFVLEEVQRWVGFALKRGDQEFGINLDGGWAGFRQLASALANDRRDFRNVTSEKLKMLLQEDHSGRWEMKDDMVRKVPRNERGQLMCEKPAVSRRPWAIVKPVFCDPNSHQCHHHRIWCAGPSSQQQHPQGIRGAVSSNNQSRHHQRMWVAVPRSHRQHHLRICCAVTSSSSARGSRI